jgi:hypothetical protein
MHADSPCSPKNPSLGQHCACELFRRVLLAVWLVSFRSSCNDAQPDQRCLGARCHVGRLTAPVPSPKNAFLLIGTFNRCVRCLVGDLEASARGRHRRVLVTAIASRASASYQSHTRAYRLLLIKTWQMSHRSGVGVRGRKCVPLRA